MYKAPRDKLVCILNCCKVISNLLVNASLASKEDHPGADEFLPVLIYVTIKANPPQLHSNLSYIQRFRRQTRLVAESAYFFTNMLSVESFISNIDAKSLSMDESEFENNMESAKQLLFGLSESSDAHAQSDQSFEHLQREESMEPKPASNSRRNQGTHNTTRDHLESSKTKSRNNEQYGNDTSSLNKIPSISDLKNRGASMLLKEEEVNRIFQDFPFLYSNAGDLTVGDVEDLLNNYKQLVFKYVCLAKGLGVSNPSPPLTVTQDHSLEQPEAAKEPEKISEPATEKTQNDLPSVSMESPKSSDLGSENTESKVLEETALEPKAEEGNENQTPQ